MKRVLNLKSLYSEILYLRFCLGFDSSSFENGLSFSLIVNFMACIQIHHSSYETAFLFVEEEAVIFYDSSPPLYTHQKCTEQIFPSIILYIQFQGKSSIIEGIEKGEEGLCNNYLYIKDNDILVCKTESISTQHLPKISTQHLPNKIIIF